MTQGNIPLNLIVALGSLEALREQVSPALIEELTEAENKKLDP